MRSKSRIKWWYFFVPLALLAVTVSYKVVEGLTGSCSAADTCQKCTGTTPPNTGPSSHCYWCKNANEGKGGCYDPYNNETGCPDYTKNKGGCWGSDCSSSSGKC